MADRIQVWFGWEISPYYEESRWDAAKWESWIGRETHQTLNFAMKIVVHPMIGAPYRFLDRYFNG